VKERSIKCCGFLLNSSGGGGEKGEEEFTLSERIPINTLPLSN